VVIHAARLCRMMTVFPAFLGAETAPFS